MIQKLINELRRIEQIKKPVLRLKEIEDFTDKTYPEMIKKEKVPFHLMRRLLNTISVM